MAGIYLAAIPCSMSNTVLESGPGSTLIMEEESAPLVDASNSSSNNATTEAIAAGSSAGASMASKASGPQVLIPLEESVQGELGDAHAQEAGSYGPYAAYAFTINYVLGSGVLGLGYAFYNGGTFASWWILMAASFLSAVSMLFIVDASARAHGLSTVVPVSADLTHGVKIEHLTKPSGKNIPSHNLLICVIPNLSDTPSLSTTSQAIPVRPLEHSKMTW